MFRLNSRQKLGILIAIAVLLCTVAGYVALAKLQPKIEVKAPIRAKPVAEIYNPAGCPPDVNPYPNRPGKALAFYAVLDSYGDERGYIFGLAAKRWGRMRDFPDWLSQALDDSRVLVVAKDRKQSPWYGGLVPGNSRSLGVFLDEVDEGGLREAFQACRLGDFWQDLHVSLAEDLYRFCLAYDDASAAELEEIDQFCGFEYDLEREARNFGLRRKAIETAKDRIAMFDAATDAQLRILLKRILNGTPWSVANVPSYSSEQAAHDVRLLAEHEPLLHRLTIVERNRLWLPRIVELLKSEVPFIVTDIGQLPGDQGLLQGLRREGFKLRRIRPVS